MSLVRPLKIRRDQIRSLVGRDDFRAIKQIEDLLRDVSGSGQLTVTSTTTSTTVADSDDIVLASGTVTITLPTAQAVPGRALTIKNIGSGVVTVDVAGAGTIDGVTTSVLAVPYQSVTVVAAPTEWVIV